MNQDYEYSGTKPSLVNKVIRFCLENKFVVVLLTLLIIGWGLYNMPFDYEFGGLERDPVPVDAIPDIGENQQIVYTPWMGRSPRDVEDQISYPLTVSLLGIPGVKTIRSYSMLGFSNVYVIFKDGVDFYWSRSRVLEKLNSLSAGTLPMGVTPALGPDATAMGQVYWYTLEGRDEKGNVTGGWGLEELRSIQDYYVRYGLLSVDGVSEVASIGGFVKEYQIDIDPDAVRAHGITLPQIFSAVKMSNVDVGARTIEFNKVEYIVRGVGYIKTLKDIEKIVLKTENNIPIYLKDVAKVSLGPALRRGVLDKEGAEAVGGVVVVRYGENPMAAIKRLKEKIKEISPGLPQKILKDGTVSQLTVVPFYDRSGLIKETLGTLENALTEEILVTMIVVIFLVMHLRSSILVSGLLPLAVLMCFIAMKQFNVDANIMALSGIAIAIGTMVDMGIILCENMLKHLDEAMPEENRLEVIYRATTEVGSAVITAISTTIVSFLPVFVMTGPEGKLFKPLAYTKTFALLASVIVALTLIPPLAHILFTIKIDRKIYNYFINILLVIAGLFFGLMFSWWLLAGIFILFGIYRFFEHFIPEKIRSKVPWLYNMLAILLVIVLLANHWVPLGPDKGTLRNLIFVAVMIIGVLLFFKVFEYFYKPMLVRILNNKKKFISIPVSIVIFSLTIWLGFSRTFFFVPDFVKTTGIWSKAIHKFPGLGKEFMPALDEGSYLYMPTTMPHASIGEVYDVLQKQDIAIRAIPEVESVVGKLGRVESALDPAPISMIETVINYKSEYKVDERTGRRIIDKKTGKPVRQWRDHIKSPNDIWDEIIKAAKIPGTTSAPKLQPIAARVVMLQSGMRAPMGVKIKGKSLEEIEKVGLQVEKFLKEVPQIEPSSVIADRIVGKPYLEIDIDRDAIARYGIHIKSVQDVIEIAVGGKTLTTTVEGRERYPVRVRYARELRDSIESLEKILVSSPKGQQIPLNQLAEIKYLRGPQVIKSEDTFLTGYVLFDMKPGNAEVNVVEMADKYLRGKIANGELQIPPGNSFIFSGSYENQVRSAKKLAIVLPLALFIIFLILYFQFKEVLTTFMVFAGIIVAWAGGFIMIWLYSQNWFLNFSVFNVNMHDLFQVHPFNLSVAVWVGFIALFGIASDDGVVMATYLNQSFEKRDPESIEEIRSSIITGASRRIRPCLMTTATTILALIPILTSTGRGADVMVPMAIPSFGGMSIELITLFIVPVLYCGLKEIKFKIKKRKV